MKAAIIGAGSIAREHLGALNELPGVTTVGVCDLSATRAESTAERFGASGWYTDYREMLDRAKPDVVHVATPAPTHFAITMDCLDAGANVLCEKPITGSYEDFLKVKQRAEDRGLMILENHNYLFNEPMQRLLKMRQEGRFGQITSVEVQANLAILGPGGRFVDRNMPHPCLTMKGGAIADFLTHIGYIIYTFIGPHMAVRSIWAKRDPESPLPSEEFRALIKGETGIGVAGFSAMAQPDGFRVKIQGTRMEAETNLWAPPRLTLKQVRDGGDPLMSVADGLGEAWDVGAGALGGLLLKLGGAPLIYDGLYELVARVYRAVERGEPSPVPLKQIDGTARLVADFTNEEFTL